MVWSEYPFGDWRAYIVWCNFFRIVSGSVSPKCVKGTVPLRQA